MTQETKDKLEQTAFETKVDYKPFSDDLPPQDYFEYGFKAGAQTILDNPQEWGFVPKSQHEHYMAKYTSLVEWYDKLMGTPCEQVRHQQEIELLKVENTRLREALERIIIESEDNEQVDWMYVAENMVDIAKEALKQ